MNNRVSVFWGYMEPWLSRVLVSGISEFPKLRGTLLWGPYNRILLFRVLY